MRTTMNLNDDLAIRAKALAVEQQTSLTRLIEEGLELRLRAEVSTAKRQRSTLPVYAGKGGLQATVVDALSHRALLDAADLT